MASRAGFGPRAVVWRPLVYTNWRDGHSRVDEGVVDEGVTVAKRKINRLLFADDLVLLTSSKINSVFNMPLIDFQLCAPKFTAFKFVKPSVSKRFSESRDPSYVGSAMCPECPKKDRWGKACWLHPRESGPEADQGPGGVTTNDLAWFRLSVKPVEISDIAENREEFRALLGLLPPHDPPQRKTWNENEGMIDNDSLRQVLKVFNW